MTANAPVELIDIGLNLTHESFAADRSELLQRAAAAGVIRSIVTGSSLTNTAAALALVGEYPQALRATAGVHPHHATELSADRLPALETFARAAGIVAVGECGLDYFRDFSPRPIQRTAFERQLELASVVRKPVFLHQRDAHEDFLAILKSHGIGESGGVAHCFTAGIEEARAYLELGLHIGITGWICDERRGSHLRDVVRFIPVDRLLVETDSPYLLPRDLEPKPRTRRNEPMYLPHIVASIATARGEDVVALAHATTRNAMRLFGWPTLSS